MAQQAFCGLIATLALAIWPSLSWSNQDIIGEWTASDFVAFNVINEKCSTLTFITRKLDIRRQPDGTLFGSMSMYEQTLWVVKNDPSCRFPVTTISDALFQRARLWPFNLVVTETARWKLGTGSAQCTGDACDQPGQNGPFTTEIQLGGEVLTDGGSGITGGGYIKYKRSSAQLQRADQAAASLADLLKPLDRGDCNGFFSDSLAEASDLRPHQTDFCKLITQLMQVEPAPIARTAISAKVPLDRVLRATQPLEVEDVLVTGFVEYQDGKSLPREVVLRKEKGRWKVLAIYGR